MSSTLSNKTIEKIILCFENNESIRAAACIAGVSNKCAKFYYDLLLERLCRVGYYQPFSSFDGVITPDDPYFSDNLYWDVMNRLEMHRGLTKEKKYLYSCKYASQYFYRCLYQDIGHTENGDNAIEKLMFRNIIEIIKITGPLNQQPSSIEEAFVYVDNLIDVWYPRSWPSEYLPYFKHCFIY